ncbi:hypothetical protein [Aeromicrobium sp. UC242_57]|uniref:hypothetical protein n=1 Tax=Aeromicrobium sp. UC242_57 TaxID=3374624 RepID=UPI00378FAC9D
MAAPTVTQLRKGWKADWVNHVQPFEVNPSSTKLVAAVKSEGFNGVALVNARTGEVVEQVDASASGEAFQAGGQANEDFAVWKEYRTPNSLDDYVVKAWDRRRHKVSQIGESRQAAGGVTYPSTWQTPVLADGRAAWVEGTDGEGGGDLVVVDLATGKRHVIPGVAHPGRLSAFDSTLIWTESHARGAPTRLHAIDIGTREPVELPQGLKGLRGAGFLVTNGKAAAWVRTDDVGVSLMVLPSMDAKPVEVKAFTDNGFSPPFSITPRLVTASISSGGILFLDLESGRFAIQDDASYAVVAGSTLMVLPFTTAKSEHPPPLPYAQISQNDAIKILPESK